MGKKTVYAVRYTLSIAFTSQITIQGNQFRSPFP